MTTSKDKTIKVLADSVFPALARRRAQLEKLVNRGEKHSGLDCIETQRIYTAITMVFDAEREIAAVLAMNHAVSPDIWNKYSWPQ